MIDSTFLHSFAIGAAATVPIVIAITQSFKMMGFVQDKYIPFISMLVGIGVAILLTHNFMQDLSNTIMSGILFGLSASGLYSGIKSTGQAIAMEKAKKAAEQREREASKASKNDTRK
jgi:type III secretory pathway component EscS